MVSAPRKGDTYNCDEVVVKEILSFDKWDSTVRPARLAPLQRDKRQSSSEQSTGPRHWAYMYCGGRGEGDRSVHICAMHTLSL